MPRESASNDHPRLWSPRAIKNARTRRRNPFQQERNPLIIGKFHLAWRVGFRVKVCHLNPNHS